LRGHLKEHFCAAPPRTIKDLIGRLQAFLTSVNANMLKHVWEIVRQCPNMCLEMDGDYFQQLL
jgi:hypothetical protein